jgi:pimeloyl-ACP methyl ester carboxylesterase
LRGYAKTSLGQIHFSRTGSGDPLVLIHRTSDSITQFDDVSGRLARKFEVIAADTPGFGASVPLDGPVGIEVYARVLRELLDTLGIARVDILGHRTGASVVAEFAAQYPERTRRVILSGCPNFDENDRTGGRVAKLPAAPGDLDYYRQSWKRSANNLGAWASPQQITRSCIDSLRAAHDTHWAYAAVYGQIITERLAHVLSPVLFLYGDQDPFKKWLPELLAATPNGSSKLLPDSNALSMLHRPELFCSAVTGFLSEE